MQMDEVFLTTTETPGGMQERGTVRPERRADHDIYEIVGTENAWHVVYGGAAGMAYVSKEAAFEAAVVAATNALRDGNEVTLHVPARVPESGIPGEVVAGRPAN
ncbi:hypothetical protein GCM10028812_29680 [Ancylobacter sonchi]